jgi:hypothetical protein
VDGKKSIDWASEYSSWSSGLKKLTGTLVQQILYLNNVTKHIQISVCRMWFISPIQCTYNKGNLTLNYRYAHSVKIGCGVHAASYLTSACSTCRQNYGFFLYSNLQACRQERGYKHFELHDMKDMWSLNCALSFSTSYFSFLLWFTNTAPLIHFAPIYMLLYYNSVLHCDKVTLVFLASISDSTSLQTSSRGFWHLYLLQIKPSPCNRNCLQFQKHSPKIKSVCLLGKK